MALELYDSTEPVPSTEEHDKFHDSHIFEDDKLPELYARFVDAMEAGRSAELTYLPPVYCDQCETEIAPGWISQNKYSIKMDEVKVRACSQVCLVTIIHRMGMGDW